MDEIAIERLGNDIVISIDCWIKIPGAENEKR